jgi:ATP-dependent DNA ligase
LHSIETREESRIQLGGLIAKEAASVYVQGRSTTWLKFKCVQQQEFVIGGFTDPQRSRIGFGALLIGYYENGKLRYAGKKWEPGIPIKRSAGGQEV